MPKIALAGFGMEGRAAYEMLHGTAEIHVFDETEVDMSGIDAVFHHGLVIPPDFAVVYKTPGIPTHKLKVSPQTRVTTLMDTVMERVGSRAVGVTGTKGKSTVTSLVYHILISAGKDAVLFGNIGVADMKLLNDDPRRIFVVEMSSYQCEHLTHSPHIAVLTSLYPEHLSHHGSFEAYTAAKLNIAKHQKPGDLFIKHDEVQVSKPFDTKLLGEHNQKNCAIALAVVQQLGISEEEARKHIATFEPLPYRMEKVGEFKGISFYDDSLATIPEATLASIAALPKVDTIILGGADRGISFEQIATELPKTGITTFIVFPDTGPRMVEHVAGTVIEVTTMEEAIRAAYEHTPTGGTVLLSNASPSFNLFKDYKDKSAQYQEWIRRLA